MTRQRSQHAHPTPPGPPDAGPEDQDGTVARRRWMGVLALAGRAELEAHWEQVAPKPDYAWLRQPETGLVMVRGRAGGTGARFNLGEMTVTRCTLRLAEGAVGTAYVAGRDRRHAELAALFDALLQLPGRREALDRTVIAPLAEAQAARQAERGRKANATRVEFFTLVRGDNPA